MRSPWFGGDNLFSTHQYPAHTLVAASEAPGFGVDKLINGRRSATDHYEPDRDATLEQITVTCNRLRWADYLAIDRDSNPLGKPIKLLTSNDNFATTETVLDITLPSVAAPDSLDGGAVTWEDAYLRRFPGRAATYWRLEIPAFPAGERPQITGLWVGTGMTLGFLDAPLEDDVRRFKAMQTESDAGWLGRGRVARIAEGRITWEVDEDEYPETELHLLNLFGDGWPAWLAFDEGRADRARLVVTAGERMGFPFTRRWRLRTAEGLMFAEHQPRRVFV